MNLGAVLVTGLFAGGVSCAAVQGGLLTGLVTRQRSDAATPARAGTSPRVGARRSAGQPAAGRGGRTAASGRSGRDATPAGTRGGAATGTLTPNAARREGAEPASSFGMRLADDLAPVGGFLAGKLVSHTLLGALLGALGGVAQLSTRVTTFAQIAAGLLIVAFGLAQLGAPGFRTLTVAPPASWARFVRGRARSRSALAPALLGAATVLVPCGVTLSVEALALTSGSPLAGAATMATFVLGTGPLFTALGYLARKAATAWQGRLAAATGLAVLLLGLYTLNTALVRAGSPLTARSIAQAFVPAPEPATAETVTVAADGRQEAVIIASPGSYSPANVAVRAGVPTTLIVRSQDAAGCERALVIPTLNKQWILPENGDTPIDLGVLAPGKLEYTCAMGMYSGTLTIT